MKLWKKSNRDYVPESAEFREMEELKNQMAERRRSGVKDLMAGLTRCPNCEYGVNSEHTKNRLFFFGWTMAPDDCKIHSDYPILFCDRCEDELLKEHRITRNETIFGYAFGIFTTALVMLGSTALAYYFFADTNYEYLGFFLSIFLQVTCLGLYLGKANSERDHKYFKEKNGREPVEGNDIPNDWCLKIARTLDEYYSEKRDNE